MSSQGRPSLSAFPAQQIMLDARSRISQCRLVPAVPEYIMYSWVKST